MNFQSVDFLVNNENKNLSDTYTKKTYSCEDENFTISAFDSVKLFEYVMNYNRDSPKLSFLKRSPSNLSDISQISSFSVQNKSTKTLYSDYKVGDYVYIDSISGVKYGVIRYVGYTEFAPGYWFGIELSEPSGKNNGTIKGKTYFTCNDLHGIFTQASKISKSPPMKKAHRLSSSGSVYGSKESVNSSVYFRKNGLNTSQESLKSCISGVSAITGVFKQPKDLKSRLLKSSTAKNDKLESSFENTCKTNEKLDSLSKELSLLSVHESEQLVKSKIELTTQNRELEETCKQYKNELADLKNFINEEKKINKELLNQLDEEKKKNETIGFRLEEETVAKLHLDEEIEKKNLLIDELKKKNEEVIISKDDENEMELFKLQEDVIKKEEKILQLENSLKTKENNNSRLLERTREFEQTIKVFEQRQENYLLKIDDLNLRLKKYELEKEQLQDELLNSNKDSKNFYTTLSELNEKNKLIEDLKDKLSKESNEVLIFKKELERINQNLQNLEQEKVNEKKKFTETIDNLNLKISILEKEKQENCTMINQSNSKQAEEKKKILNDLENSSILIKQHEDKIKELTKLTDISNKEKEEDFLKLKKELKSNQAQLNILKTELENVEKNMNLKEKEIEKLNLENKRYIESIERNTIEKQEIENELDNLKNQLEEKETDLNSFNKKKLKFQNEMQELIRELTNEKEKNRELLMNKNQMNDSQKDQLKKAYTELDTLKLANEKINSQLNEQVNLVENLKKKYSEKNLENQNLEQSNHELKLIIDKRDNDQSLLINEFEKKIEKYEKKIQNLHDSLVDKDVEMNSLKLTQQQNLEKMRLDFSLNCNDLEEKIIDLKQNLDNQQKQLIEEKTKNLEKSRRLSQIEEEQLNNDDKDLYESQIEFLNSVIVDMQMQNDDLKNKIKMLEDIRQDEINMFKPNLEDNTKNKSSDQNPFNFKQVTNNLNFSKDNFSHQLLFKNTQRATRLFCSFCDEFDKHDTDDCLINSKTNEVQHSKHGLSKKVARPYCVECEEFSHWTYDCPNKKELNE